LPEQPELNFGDNMLEPEKTDKILQKLVERGIAKAVAQQISNTYSIEQIENQISAFDWLVKKKSPLVEKNPAGFLRKAIEENYQPPQEFLDKQESNVRKEKEKDRKERWIVYREKLINHELANWDSISPASRIEGRLNFWITGETMNGRKPTPEQIEIKKQELIDSLPKTDEDKFEYLSQNYPEVPPNDFE